MRESVGAICEDIKFLRSIRQPRAGSAPREAATVLNENRLSMAVRRLFAWWVYVALTTPIGLLAHFVFEAYGRRDDGFSPFEPDHIALMGVIVCLVAAATFALRRGSREERRLRLEVLRASMPRGLGLAVATGGVQLGVAAGTLALEHVAIDPARIACALLLAVATALFGASVFLHVEDAVLHVAAAVEVGQRAPGLALCLADVSPSTRGTGRIGSRAARGRAPPFQL
jgi:hypothetical protein